MFREKITRHYQSLSPSFKKIADFILTSHQRAAFMSASRLAKHLGVDVATVTRFAQQIGYDGYVELIREVQELVLAEMRKARSPVTDRLDQATHPFMLHMWRDWANLEKSIQNIPLEDAERALAAIDAARRIYVVSEGIGSGLAQVMASYLTLRKPDVRVLSQGPFDVAMALKDITANDLVIAVGFTDYAYIATRAIEVANRVGAQSIGIISQADCPIGAVAQILLACSATEEGYLPAPTCVASILFSLAYTYLMSDGDAHHQNLLKFQEAYSDLTEGTPRGEDDVFGDLIARF